VQPSSSCSVSGSNLNSAKRKVFLLLVPLVIACLISAHIYVNAQGPNYAGFLLILDHLFDLGIVLILLAVCVGVGKRLLASCRYTFNRPLEMLLFSVAIGCGTVSTVLLAIGFLSGLQPITLTVVLMFLALLAMSDILSLPRLLAHATLELKERSNIFSLLVFGIAASFMIAQALLPPTDWDDLMYHLRAPTQFLEAGRIYVPEDNLHVAFVQLVHMLYLPLLAYGSTSGPALLSAFFALLLGLAVFALSSRFFAGPTAAFSLALLWGNTMVLLVAITARLDVTLAYYLFLAHFALLKASSNWKCFYLSAVLLGFAVGLKHTALAYALALSPLIVWVAVRKKQSLGASIHSLFTFSLLALFGSLPWFTKNWLLFDAPLYPFFAQRKVDSWLAFIYPEHTFPLSLDPKIWTLLGEVRAPFNLIDLFLNPHILTVEPEALFYNTSPLFLGLVLWVIYYRKDTNLNWLMIPALSYLAALILFSPKTNLRYLMPVIAPFTIVAAHVTVCRLVTLVGLKRAVVLFQILLLVALWPAAKAMAVWTTTSTTFGYLAGFASRNDYLLNGVLPRASYPYANVVYYVNRHIPPGDKVLFLFEARGFYFDVPVIQDNLLTNWPLLASRASSLHCLESTGISHVLINRGALNYYLMRGLDPGTVQWDTFRQFEEECLVPVLEESNYVLYRVRK
jgi:hypothetical protein